MKVAIIGSRDFMDKTYFFNYLQHEFYFSKPDKIISGGARGIDTWAEEYANKNDIEFEKILPINTLNKINYLFRNIEIITKSDKIYAFWDGKSKGTKFVIDYAKARKKDIEIILRKEALKEEK